MSSPKVSIVCLCYNHVRFVREAIESIFAQSYSNIELIVVDDASTDGSQEEIRHVLKNHPSVLFLSLEKNVGNCRAFNEGWRKSTGDFVIDLAADDVLLPNRVERGVATLTAAGPATGVQFSDAYIIDESGGPLGFHSDKHPHATIPQGDVYVDVIRRYFICGPTTMARRAVLEQLNGYDETLFYEDFDFWIRSSRTFHYCYLTEPLVKYRRVKGSMSHLQFNRGNKQQESTYRICRKIQALNRNDAERAALQARVRYELFQAIRRFDLGLAWKYLLLLRENSRAQAI